MKITLESEYRLYCLHIFILYVIKEGERMQTVLKYE